MIRELNAFYLTPIDRVDLLTLITKLDDIVDGMNKAAMRFDMFSIHEVDSFMVSFVSNIKECVEQVECAVKSLAHKKLNEIRPYAIRINELENEADKLLRDAVKSIFTRTNDPVEVIKLREIYMFLEEVSDSCEDVADILESIIMTNQ
jgi:uncharacterized protein Yka (UPF0111/DUF47 family)